MKFKALTTLVLLFAGSSHAQQSNNQYFQEQQQIQNQNHAAEQNRQGYMGQQQQMQQQQQQLPPQPTGYWEKTWGSIATSETGGSLGTALGASSESEAEQMALADCKAKGGGGCEVGLTYHNQCAVAVIGKNTFRMYGAASIDEAIADGMRDCATANRDNSSCRVYYSACTEPIFHKY